MRLRFVLTLAAALASLASAARALPTATQIKTAFTELDASHNAAINADEWDRASFALFHAADKNKNDFIDAAEIAASGIVRETFVRTDTDRDGKLSVGEFMEFRRTIFQIADIDHDDNVAFVEYELLIVMEQIGWSDRNHNDRIELSELRGSLTNAFSQLDADHDGKLTATEASFMPAAEFKKFDSNHDGQLSADEFNAGYRTDLLGGY